MKKKIVETIEAIRLEKYITKCQLIFYTYHLNRHRHFLLLEKNRRSSGIRRCAFNQKKQTKRECRITEYYYRNIIELRFEII